ncbi:unnamed protein product [Bursaphelenchus xylophilus]|uniref:Golgi SNAP receptor complex member 1 n=1 Tax=Bursaphelenchus xylophilus TaxID=6326 RepID=A0A1I7S021_BURXY|nr:unnamed protein product [Bursaphelenchus xylophilus]CAG9109074.1 unnamed protein product [Bursaphelenchus xylophilus]
MLSDGRINQTTALTRHALSEQDITDLNLDSVVSKDRSLRLPERFGGMEVQWSELRQNASSLEREIDELLGLLNGVLPKDGRLRNDASYLAAQRSQFEKVSADLDSRTSRLQDINERMNAYLSEYERNGHYDQSMRSLYFRHREMFRSYCQELSRSQSNISNELKRAELLCGSTATQSEGSALSNRAKTSDYLLRENDRINSCDRLLDDQISIAIGIKDSVQNQKLNMNDISRKLHLLGKKYPALGSLMTKIRAKKRKDTIILAGVITTCLIFIFFYLNH